MSHAPYRWKLCGIQIKDRLVRNTKKLVHVKKKFLIMNRNTSVSLGSYFDSFIQSRISAGRFKNASEFVRAGLRLLEEEENKIIVLKEAIKEGIDSGAASDFNPQNHLQNLKAQKNLND
jgi:antitoxin ParD1/3/4